MEGEAKTVIEQIEAIKDTDEFKTLVKNEASKHIGGEIKTLYTNIDNVVTEVLGVEKPDDVKTSDWVKAQLSKIKETQTELEALKGKGEKFEAQEQLWNEKYNTLNEQLEQQKTEFSKLKQEGFESNLKNQIDSYLVDKTFLAHYTEDDIKTQTAYKRNLIISNTQKLENGKIAVKNADTGEYYLDTLGEPLSPAKVAELMFSKMFVSKTPGGSADPNNQPLGAKGDALNMSDVINDIKTKEQFYAAFDKLIAPKGLKSHDEKYLKIQRATIEHYKINALPLD
jgi:hypothetical protein